MKKISTMNSLMSESETNMEEQKKIEFLAAIKLVSGEEILAVTEHVNDENGDYMIVQNPIEIEEVMLQGNKPGAKVTPCMKFSEFCKFLEEADTFERTPPPSPPNGFPPPPDLLNPPCLLVFYD